MATATALQRILKESEILWQEFNRAEGKRNYVRAAALARELQLNEQRLRALQFKALRQFLAEYQNFEGAARLCVEYALTAEELAALTADVLKQEGLETKTNFSLHAGRPAYLSVAAQVRLFARQQAPLLRQREAQGRGWWQRLATKIRSWFDHLSMSGHKGRFPRGGVAW